MSCSIDWSAWVTAIATVVSAGIAYFMWLVSQSLFNLQKSVESAKNPKVHFWCNGTNSINVINIGKQSLPIRRLRFLEGYRSPTQKHIQFNFRSLNSVSSDSEKNIASARLSELTNLIFNPNDIHEAWFDFGYGQLTVEVMYYDNSFEFIEIDTSNLGGKYILTGQGRKC